MLPDDYDWFSQSRPNHALTALYTGKHFLMYGFIGLFILILCIIIVRYCLCRYKRYQRQQKILQQINRAEQIYLKNNQLMSLIESYNMMMKRTLREYYPEINVASMSGIQWLS
ncbi:MAG: DUF4381 family protein, partial [Endozoicomonadaceae bacterium]|nr:DUF4381 family protein [Endozoicomonadaceae bacterium]